MEEYTIANKKYKIYNLRLIEIVKETPDAYSYRFALDGLEYKFEPGQFVILFVDIDKIKSYFEEKYLKKEISDSLFQKILKNLEAEKSKAEREGRPLELGRRYSIASSPTRNDYIEITIERYIERDKQTGEIKYLGLLSNYFIDNAKVGEYYKISEAAGSFIFKEGMCDYLNLLAGGSGIVPFMCYIRYAVDKNLDLNINLLYSNRTKDYIIYKSELDEIASKFSNIKITHVLTREKDLSYAKFYGRIDTPEKLLEWLPKEILTHERASNRICGSADYIKSMIRLLTNPTIGVKPSNIMIESYYA